MKPEESMSIIQSMIETSKQTISDGSKYYLLWGWAVFISAIIHFIMIKMHYPGGMLVWLSMPATAVIALLIGMRDKKTQRVKTYTGDALSKLWLSLTFGFILLTYFQLNGHGNSIPLFILLYGIGILTTGNILQFNPMILGGISCFIISVIGMRMDNNANQLILLAAAILVSYIIPGYMLKAACKKQSA
jgi:hypothetical protein